MAFDHSAQERCPLQLDSISPSLIYPQEKLCLGMEVTLFVVVNYKEGNQTVSSLEALFKRDLLEMGHVVLK